MSIFNTNLPDRATEVINAGKEQNTALRVGSLFADIISYIGSQEPDWLRDTGGSGGGGSYTTPGALLQSLWQQGNPAANKILKYDGNNWVPIDVPAGGGSGSGMDVAAMWAALQSTTGDYANTKIPANHLDLTSCLKTNTTFWGNTANTTSNPNAVTGSLSGGIQFVEFSNNVKIGIDPNNPDTIRIYKDNNDSAHFYATGGVSALGYSSSGGGGGGGDTPLNLNAILASINGSNNTVPTFDNALKYAVLRTNQGWQVLENTLGRLSNVQLNNNLDDGQALVYNSNGYWENRTVSSGGGTLSINGLDEVVNSFNSLEGGQVLTYSSSLGKWTNADLPAATSAISGIMKIGNDTVQTIAANTPTATTGKTYPIQLNSSGQAVVNVPWENTVYSHPTYTAQSSLKLYRITVDNLGHVASTAVADKYDIANVLEGHTSVEISITGSAAKLNESIGSRSIWGQTYWNEGLPQNVQGDLIVEKDTTTNNESIKLSPNTLNVENPKIYMLGRNILEYERSKNNVSVDTLAIGFGAEGNNLTHTNIIGKNIELTSTVGNVYIPNASTLAKGLRIGDAVLYWDSQNNSLAVKKYDDSACNFYAFGGVSALGMSSGIGTIPTMTFGNLAVTTNLNTKKITTSDGNIVVNNSGIKLDGTNSDQFIDLDENSYIRFTCEDQGTDIKIILKSDTDGLYIKVGNGSYKKILTAS